MTVDPKDANAILAKYNTLHDIFDCTERLRNDPPLLAHYTSIEVIEKIIKNEEIWLSHPFYMNDLSELRFGMLQGIQVFPAYALPAVATQERVRLILEAFNFYVGHMNEHTLVDTYVLCLSEHAPGNTNGVLSMWRSYASQGHGAALVINTRNIPDPPQAPLRIAKLIYGSPEKRIKLIQKGLEEWAKITRAANPADNLLHIAALGAFQFIKAFALMTKHDGFLEEAEWRIIYVPENDPDKRLVHQLGYSISPRGVEPRLKFKIAPVLGGPPGSLSLSRLTEFILLGPSISSPIVKSTFSRVLAGTCLNDFADRVFASTIPLRPTVG